MMTRKDELLNALVYEIDDMIYDFYTESNHIIAVKTKQDELVNFRDKSVEIINDMNVRSLEMIAQLREGQALDERMNKLLNKNKELLDSCMTVIKSASNKSEIMEDLNTLGSSMYDSAKDLVSKVEESGVIEKFAQKTKEGLESVINHPSVQKGTEVVSQKSKEAAERFSSWVKDRDKALVNVENDVEDLVEDIQEESHDLKDEFTDNVNLVKDKAEDLYDNVSQELDKSTEVIKNRTEDIENNIQKVQEESLHFIRESKHHLDDAVEEVKEDVVNEKSNNL